MPASHDIAVVVRIRPKPGAEEGLLKMRDEWVQSYRDTYPGFVGTTLIRAEQGTWLDIWYYADRETADETLAHPERTPLYKIWGDGVELVQFERAEVLMSHTR